MVIGAFNKEAMTVLHYWLAKSDKIGADRAKRGAYFDSVLTIYGYPFLGDTDHTQFVRDVYTDTDRSMRIERSYRIAASKRYGHSSIPVLTTAILRLPIYIGGRVNVLPGYKKLMADSLGYQVEDDGERFLNFHRYGNPAYYAIAAETVRAGAPFNKKDMPALEARGLFVCHVLGVNLESKTSADYMNMYVNGLFDLERYTERVREMARICVAAAVASVEASGRLFDTTDRQLVLRVPAIGLGAYARHYGGPLGSNARLLFEAFRDAALAEPRVRVLFCIFEDSLREKFDEMRAATAQAGNVMDKAEKNLFEIENEKVIHGPVCLVNAWDSLSFIGNGGSRDPTIDGFIVSDCRNENMRNACYLHNPFFFPKVLTRPQTFVYI